MSLIWILILSVGSPLVYLFGVGVTYALCPSRWTKESWEVLGVRGWVATCWPLTGPVCGAVAITQWLMARSHRASIPRAEVRRG